MRRREVARLEEIVRRQGEAIEVAIAALTRLSQRGSLRKDVREDALRRLVESRNERLA